MSHKYERQCWYCGSKDLEDLGEYVKCRKCSATWNDLPKGGASPVTERRDLGLEDYGVQRFLSPSPSDASARRAARARESAGG